MVRREHCEIRDTQCEWEHLWCSRVRKRSSSSPRIWSGLKGHRETITSSLMELKFGEKIFADVADVNGLCRTCTCLIVSGGRLISMSVKFHINKHTANHQDLYLNVLCCCYLGILEKWKIGLSDWSLLRLLLTLENTKNNATHSM